MAKIFNGETFITLGEYLLITEGVLPPIFSAVTLPTVGTTDATTFKQALQWRYFFQYLFTSDTDEFGNKLAALGYEILPTLSEKLTNLAAMVPQLLADKETETSDTLRSPSGTLQTSGYSAGGIKRERVGGSSGNVDRLVRYQNERKQLITEALDAFQPLFIQCWDDWGKKVDEE